MDRLESTLSTLSHLNLAGDVVEKQEHAAGFGGSCDVYSAWSRRHGKKVAVKQIRTYLKKEPTLAKRLAKEIRIWARLVHCNVLPFLGYFTEGENMTPSMVSEWMQNGTMHDYIRRFPRGGTIARIMLRGVASGLAYLHAKEVIHADLKSQNIMISPYGIPLLADFGLSLALSQSQYTSGTTATTTKGTVRWMAIELLVPNDSGIPTKHDEKSDVWAFGMVIYELLSWKAPYWAKPNYIHVVMTIVNGELPEKPAEGADLSVFDDLWTLSQSCWYESSLRPTAGQLVDRLSIEIVSPRKSREEGSSYTRRRLWRKAINACIAIHRMQMWSNSEGAIGNKTANSEIRRRLWRKAVNACIAIQRMRPLTWSRRRPSEGSRSDGQRRLWHKAVNACIAIYRMRTWAESSDERRLIAHN